MSFAHRERLALVAALAEAGADAPTLCGEWTGRDLAAHLVIRERRPDASAGILVKRLAGYTDKVQQDAAKRPWAELLEQVRSGPPIWSPLRPVDALVNASEMFVHHEDVRRAVPDWEPRILDPADEKQLWNVLRRMAKMSYRAAPVGVVLETLTGERVVAKKPAGKPQVVLKGAASELLLHAFGRDQARIEYIGDQADVAAVKNLDRSV